MTKISFYGAVDEIGGNKILIEDGTKKGIAEDFIEKAERTQIMATIIFASFAFFAVRFLYYPNKSENFYLSGKKVHHKENQPQRAQSSDIFFSVYSVISVVFQIKKINQRKPIEKELITCN